MAFYTMTKCSKSKFIRDADCCDLTPCLTILLRHFRYNAVDNSLGSSNVKEGDDAFTGDAITSTGKDGDKIVPMSTPINAAEIQRIAELVEEIGGPDLLERAEHDSKYHFGKAPERDAMKL